ncbi:hypothetical protein GCM10019059_35930 [Camelimonas fluminis]|uniref:CpaD family pilus assembly protein n=1 Tax=Camelimonas fluminis TaxID=1576911 RepID=A0ABV7UH24_9HYPH|nr:CpaD family pilus assembly protein [Camelimonas fluminis]GHE73186.1 hypothetical protein GCM10019059_35930 [Camelimonas fluminis]
MQKIAAFTILSSLALSGCAGLQESNPPLYPTDYKERFKIELMNAPQEMEIYPLQHTGLDPDQRKRLASYAAAYRRFGKSVVTVSVPTGPDGKVTARTAAHTKRVLDVLHANGVAKGNIHGQTYLPDNPLALNPVKITYSRPTAGVAAKCGLWTDDVGFASVGTDIENLPYYNLGCATQTAVAKQIADPMDVVRHQQETPADAARSTTVLNAWRTRGPSSASSGTSPGGSTTSAMPSSSSTSSR